MSTLDDLKAAFAGESQANRKYLAFAKKADTDKLPMIAKLFRAAAEAETIHAHGHLRVLGGIGTTEENLKTGIAGESYEFKEMYPEFLERAIAEGNKAAEKVFRFAMEAEKTHYDLYSQALEMVRAGKDLPDEKLYICPVCGHTVMGALPDNCPICNVPKSQYIEIK